MSISPDEIVYWRSGVVVVNATLVTTWVVMGVTVLLAWWVTHDLESPRRVRWRNFLETLVGRLRTQISEVSGQDPRPYLPFIGTVYLFIAVANFLAIVPGYHPPTGSLSTTGALAVGTLLAAPVYAIRRIGLRGFLQHYVQPTVLMLPFHVLGEVARTIALAVRLFGNVMSGTFAVAILLYVTPLFVPVVMQALELLIGQVQAYIFAVLSTVYIAAASQVHERRIGGLGPAAGQPAGMAAAQEGGTSRE